MAKEKLNIGGYDFEVVRPRKRFPDVERVKACNGLDLFDYYSNPSSAKHFIYRKWLSWFANSDNVYYFGISSANCQTFCLSALYKDDNGETYVLAITPDHLRATATR